MQYFGSKVLGHGSRLGGFVVGFHCSVGSSAEKEDLSHFVKVRKRCFFYVKLIPPPPLEKKIITDGSSSEMSMADEETVL